MIIATARRAARNGLLSKRKYIAFFRHIDARTQQAIVFSTHYAVALAASRFETGPIDNRDVAAAGCDEPQVQQLAGGFRNSFSTHTQYI
jgi:hypothetical protein